MLGIHLTHYHHKAGHLVVIKHRDPFAHILSLLEAFRSDQPLPHEGSSLPTLGLLQRDTLPQANLDDLQLEANLPCLLTYIYTATGWVNFYAG